MPVSSQQSAITIRAATLKDEAAILSLIEELFEAPGIPPRDYTIARGREGVRYAVENPEGDVLLAFEGGRPVGLASVYKDYFSIRDGWRCWLQDLVVTKTHRGAGVGAKLLEAAMEWARGHESTHLSLNSGVGRKDAHRFYLREGMTQGSLNFTKAIE